MDSIYSDLDRFVKEEGNKPKHKQYIDDNAERILREIGTSLQKDEIVLQYARYVHQMITKKLPVTIVEPWMALGERKMTALTYCMPDYPMTFNWQTLDHMEDLKSRLIVVGQLLMSQLFMWSSEVWQLVMQYPLPVHTVSRDVLPFPFSYHSFEKAISIAEVESDGEGNVITTNREELSCDWMMCRDIPLTGGCEVLYNADLSDKTSSNISMACLQYGSVYPDSYKDVESICKSVGIVLSMFAFLKSPFISVEERQLPRQWRRSGKLDKATSDTRIRVVQLRKEAKRAVEAYNSESREWKHKWWVKGHFRNQWRPSTKDHEVIWIAPYLKGDENLPMLEKVYKVSR